MLYFDLSAHQDIIDNHYLKLKSYLLGKISGSNINQNIKLFLRTNLEEILKSKPEELLVLNSLLENHKSYKTSLKTKINKIFNYKYFINKKENKYDAYDLANSLNLRTCLYCNRSYTLTLQKGNTDNDKITRPEFDHFFDQDTYPMLALSIFNLIPSCKICNSTLKNTTEFSIAEYIHPYIDNTVLNYNYEFLPYEVSAILGASSKLGVKIKAISTDTLLNSKIKKSADIFKLNDIMSSHSEELKDIFDIKHHFAPRYFQELVKNYESLDLEYDDMFRIIFGTYSQEADFSKRPFSKLKKDILLELGVI